MRRLGLLTLLLSLTATAEEKALPLWKQTPRSWERTQRDSTKIEVKATSVDKGKYLNVNTHEVFIARKKDKKPYRVWSMSFEESGQLGDHAHPRLQEVLDAIVDKDRLFLLVGGSPGTMLYILDLTNIESPKLIGEHYIHEDGEDQYCKNGHFIAADDGVFCFLNIADGHRLFSIGKDNRLTLEWKSPNAIFTEKEQEKWKIDIEKIETPKSGTLKDDGKKATEKKNEKF